MKITSKGGRDLTQWHRWFAWYPVKTSPTKTVYLESVFRRADAASFDGYGGYMWRYLDCEQDVVTAETARRIRDVSGIQSSSMPECHVYGREAGYPGWESSALHSPVIYLPLFAIAWAAFLWWAYA